MKVIGWKSNQNEADTPYGAWKRPALNCVVNLDGLSLSNEGSTELVLELDQIVGKIQTPNEIIIFTKAVNFEVIYVYDKNGIRVALYNPGQFELFSYSDAIQGVYKYNEIGELEIAFWDGVSSTAKGIYVLNLDRLPYPAAIDKHFLDPSDYEKLNINPSYFEPSKFNLASQSGGDVPTGAFQFIIQYEITDVDYTAYSGISTPIFTYKSHTTHQGDSSGKSIIVTLDDLDDRYRFYRLLVMRTIDQITDVREIGRYSITTNSIIYNGKHTPRAVELNEVLIPPVFYTHAAAGTVLDNKLYLGNVKVPALSYQRHANNILITYTDNVTTNFITDNTVETETQEKGTIQHDERGLAPYEVYSLSIQWKFKRGGWSSAFHIPGRKARFIPTIVLQGIQIINITGTFSGNPIFEVVSSASLTALAGAVDYEFTVAGITYHITNITSGATTFLQADTDPEQNLTALWVVAGKLGVLSSVSANTEDELLDTVGHIGESIELQNLIGEDLRWFHFGESGFGGKPGYWQNEHDFYPNDATEYTDIFDSGGNIIGSIAGENIRHHRMPSLRVMFAEKASGTELNKQLQLQIGRIAITDEILELCDGYRIMYAERDINNQQVVSYGTLLAEYFDKHPASAGYPTNRLYDVDNPLFRMYNYPLGAIKPNLDGASYITEELKLTSDRIFHVHGSTEFGFELTYDSIYGPEPWIISNAKYIPFNNGAVAPSNVYREDALRFNTSRHYPPAHYNGTNYQGHAHPVATTEIIMVGLRILKLDVYATIRDQTIVNTNAFIKVSIDDEYNNGYDECIATGFDTMLAEDYIRYGEGSGSASPAVIGWPIGIAIPVRMYFKTYAIAVHGFNNELEPGLEGLQLRAINKDYLTIGNKASGQPVNYLKPTIFAYPSLIVYSIGSGGLLTDNWRVFLTNDIYDKIRHRGAVISMTTFDERTMLIHFKNSLFLASVKDEIATDQITAYLGTGSLFDSPVQELLSLNENYVGIDGRFSSILTPFGYAFSIDGRIYLYQGTIKEISFDNKEWIKKRMKPEGDDNPYNGGGNMPIIFGYDHKFRRLLITKVPEFQFEDDGDDIITIPPTDALTLSYSFVINSFVGKHLYRPNGYINLNDNTYGLTTYLTIGNMFKHNSETDFNNYYGLWNGAFYVDLVFPDNKTISNIYETIRWWTDLFKVDSDNENTLDRGLTFMQIMVYNKKQSSGYVTIDQRNINVNTDQQITAWFEGNTTNNNNFWSFNDFRDIVNDYDSAFLDETDTPIDANLTPNKSWFKKHRFEDSFVVVRFWFKHNKRRLVFHDAVVSKTQE